MADDLTAEEYQHALSVLNDPNAKLSDEERTLLLQYRDTYENAHAAAQGVDQQLNPSLPLLPQALTLQPASTHPEGDEKAGEDWIRDPEKASQGAIFMYEPPLQAAKKELLENPSIIRALYQELGDDYIADPQEIAKLTPSDPLYQAYSDYKWREAADEAAKSGKTAYRYSKAPWLQGPEGLSALDTLGLKARGAVPVAGAQEMRFVLGLDKAATLGAQGRGTFATAQSANPTLPYQLGNPGIPGATDMSAPPNSRNYVEEREKNGPQGDEYRNDEDPSKESYDQFMSGGHGVAALGQGIGTLAPWGAANRAFALASGAAAPIAGLGTSTLRTGLAAAAGGAGGAALEQTGLEGVNAAAQAGSGQQTDLSGAPGRIGISSVLGGATGGALDFLGGGGANYIRHESPRYGGAIGEFEAAGGKMGLLGGPKAPPEAEKAVLEARARQVDPVDVQAQQLAPKIEASVAANKAAVREQIAQKNAPFYASNEGQMRLPVSNVEATALDILRRGHAPDSAGALRPNVDPAAVRKVRSIFSSEMDRATTKPAEGALELSPQEAETFLTPLRKKELLAEITPKKGPKAPTTGSREIDLEAPGEETAGEASLEEALRKKGIDKVYVVPRRYTAAEHENAKERLQTLKDSPNPAQREARELYLAVLKDRDARPLNGVPGAWSAQQQQNAKALGVMEDEASLAAPQGNSFRPLVDYSKRHKGQVELTDAVRGAAGRAGVREELDRMRVLGLLDNLNRLSSPLGGTVGGFQRSALGPNALFDAGTLGAGYPLLRLLEGPLGGLRGGVGGAVAPAIVDNQEREKP